MPHPHVATLFGAIALAGFAVYRRRARPAPVRVIGGGVAAIIGAAIGALIDAGALASARVDWTSPRVEAARRELSEVDWGSTARSVLADPDARWIIIGGAVVVALAVAASLAGFGIAVRAAFRRTAVWFGAGLALIVSATILVITKIPYAREDGGWILIAAAMVAAGLLNGRLFGSRRGIYWDLPGADPRYDRELSGMRPPPFVKWLARLLLTRVLRTPPAEVDRAMSLLDQGIGPAMAAATEAESQASRGTRPGERVIWARDAAGVAPPPRMPSRLRDPEDVDAMLAALRAQRDSPAVRAHQRQRVLVAAMIAAAGVVLLLFWFGRSL